MVMFSSVTAAAGLSPLARAAAMRRQTASCRLIRLGNICVTTPPCDRLHNGIMLAANWYLLRRDAPHDAFCIAAYEGSCLSPTPQLWGVAGIGCSAFDRGG